MFSVIRLKRCKLDRFKEKMHLSFLRIKNQSNQAIRQKRNFKSNIIKAHNNFTSTKK